MIRAAEKLPDRRTGNHIAGQSPRSGSSPLPNHAEAQALRLIPRVSLRRHVTEPLDLSIAQFLYSCGHIFRADAVDIDIIWETACLSNSDQKSLAFRN
jgi:hypothetical protein